MSEDLAETFGESFVEEFEREKERRRQEREKVSDEAKNAIAEKIISGDDFTGESPMTQYTTESGVTHDVLLMTLPDPDQKSVWQYLNELESGAATIPMDFMGDWMSCLFNDRNELKEMDAGESYIIIGNLSQWEKDDGSMEDQISPVRGVMTPEEARERAEGEISKEVNEEEPDVSDVNEDEPEEDDDDEEEDGDDDSGSSSAFDLGGSDDDDEDDAPEIEKEDTFDVLNSLPEEKKDQMVEFEEGDDELTDVAMYVMKENGYEEFDEDVAPEIKDHILEWIDNATEDEEEEDEDDDLLGGDDDSLFS